MSFLTFSYWKGEYALAYSKDEKLSEKCNDCVNNEGGHCIVFKEPYYKWYDGKCEAYSTSFFDIVKIYHDTLVYSYKKQMHYREREYIRRKLKYYLQKYLEEIKMQYIYSDEEDSK